MPLLLSRFGRGLWEAPGEALDGIPGPHASTSLGRVSTPGLGGAGEHPAPLRHSHISAPLEDTVPKCP